jgi:hypothetical protein
VRGGSDASGGVEIYQADRDTMQRAAIVAMRQFVLRLASLLQRQLGRERDEGVEAQIDGLDARQLSLCSLQR